MKKAALGDKSLTMVKMTEVDMPKNIYRAIDDKTLMVQSPATLCDLTHRVSPDIFIEPLEAKHLLTTIQLKMLNLQKLEAHLKEQLETFK